MGDTIIVVRLSLYYPSFPAPFKKVEGNYNLC
jgi:hypothetical protein